MSKIPRFGLFGSKPTLNNPSSPLAKVDTVVTNNLKDDDGVISSDKTETDDLLTVEPARDQPLQSQQSNSSSELGVKEQPIKQDISSEQAKRVNKPVSIKRPRKQTRDQTIALNPNPRKRQRKYTALRLQEESNQSRLQQLYSKYEKQYEIYTKHKQLMDRAELQMHQTVLAILQLRDSDGSESVSETSPELFSSQNAFDKDVEVVDEDSSDSQSLPDPNDVLNEET